MESGRSLRNERRDWADGSIPVTSGCEGKMSSTQCLCLSMTLGIDTTRVQHPQSFSSSNTSIIIWSHCQSNLNTRMASMAKTKQFRVATFNRPKTAIPTALLGLFSHAHTSSLLSSLLLRGVFYSRLHAVDSGLNVLDSGFPLKNPGSRCEWTHCPRDKLAHAHGHTTVLGYDVQA